jgi:uncharacterized protein HemY
MLLEIKLKNQRHRASLTALVLAALVLALLVALLLALLANVFRKVIRKVNFLKGRNKFINF